MSDIAHPICFFDKGKMITLLKFDEIKEMGFKLSLNINKKEVERIIFNTERKFVKKNISNYKNLTTKEDEALEDVLPILKAGIGNLVFGFLLNENVVASRFGTVKKQSDFSIQALKNEVRNESAKFFEVGCELLRDAFLEMKEIQPSIEVFNFPYYNYLRGFYHKK